MEKEQEEGLGAPLLAHDAFDLQHAGAMDWLGRPAHSRLGGWKCAFLILGALVLCLLAPFGIIYNLVVFLIEHGYSNADAAATVTTLTGTQLFCSFLGALISDSCLGRLYTSLLFQILSALCYILVGLSVVVVSATDSGRSLLLVSLYMTVITTGLVFPNLLGLGVDQLNSNEDKEKYFQFVAIATLLGQLLATTLVTYIDNKGMWVWGFWSSSIASLACLSLIAVGLRWSRQYTASGNPCLRNFQVVVAALRKHRLPLPEDSALLHECKGDKSTILGCCKLPHTHTLSFLDKAAVVEVGESKTWHLCTVTQVEELKRLLRIIPAGLSIAFASVAVTQTSTLFEEQALTMNRHLGSWVVAPASLNALSIASGILTGFVTTAGNGTKLSRWCFGFIKQGRTTSLQVLGISLLCSMIAMVIAALVESHRLHVAQQGYMISVLWLAPQTILLGAASNLISSGSLDFFYSEISDSMLSMAGSLSIVFYGVGSYLNTTFVSLVTAITTSGGQPGWIADNLDKGHADYFYWFLAACVAFGLACHIAYARAYNYTGCKYVDIDEKA